MYMYIYIYMHVYKYEYIYTHVYIYVYLYISMNNHMHIHAHTHSIYVGLADYVLVVMCDIFVVCVFSLSHQRSMISRTISVVFM